MQDFIPAAINAREKDTLIQELMQNFEKVNGA